ncbi:MAG: hypothetical protein ACOC8H_01300 [bacterium]
MEQRGLVARPSQGMRSFMLTAKGERSASRRRMIQPFRHPNYPTKGPSDVLHAVAECARKAMANAIRSR